MNKIFILLFALIFNFKFYSQNCKPDQDIVDKVTKEENKVWQLRVFDETNKIHMFSDNTDWTFIIQFRRQGYSNFFSAYLIKSEFANNNSVFESQYNVEKGKEIQFGMKNGDPLSFIIEYVKRESVAPKEKNAYTTTFSMHTHLTEERIEDIKRKLDSNVITSVRVQLANGFNYTKEIGDKKTEKFTHKFNCFYNFNKDNKVNEPDWSDLPPNPNVPENLPLNNEEKISFVKTGSVDNTSKDELYNRALAWMKKYYKNEKFEINSKEDGHISKLASFEKHYNVKKAQKEKAIHPYSIIVKVKDNKYKVEITDIKTTEPNGKTLNVEEVYKTIAHLPKYTKYCNQQIYEGAFEIINSLEKAMNEAVKKDDW